MSRLVIPPSRAAENAYQAIEQLIATLKLEPGQAIVESDLVELTQLGRTPIREALMRMVAMGLIEQQPRRGLRVSEIRVAEHLTLIETRRALERLIVLGAARWATPAQRSTLLGHAQAMVDAADAKDIDAYMLADQHLDEVIHQACRNPFAVQAIIPMIVQCRRFWYAYQYEGDLEAGAKAHLTLAEGIQDGNPEMALQGSETLMEYLSTFTRKVIE